MINISDVREFKSNRLWKEQLPHLALASMERGEYTVLSRVPGETACADPLDAAWQRLELATCDLWDEVEFLFESATFPHLLAAATDVLRGSDYAEMPQAWVQQRQLELAAAMQAVEDLLAANDGNDQPPHKDSDTVTQCSQSQPEPPSESPSEQPPTPGRD